MVPVRRLHFSPRTAGSTKISFDHLIVPSKETQLNPLAVQNSASAYRLLFRGAVAKRISSIRCRASIVQVERTLCLALSRLFEFPLEP